MREVIKIKIEIKTTNTTTTETETETDMKIETMAMPLHSWNRSGSMEDWRTGGHLSINAETWLRFCGSPVGGDGGKPRATGYIPVKGATLHKLRYVSCPIGICLRSLDNCVFLAISQKI